MPGQVGGGQGRGAEGRREGQSSVSVSVPSRAEGGQGECQECLKPYKKKTNTPTVIHMGGGIATLKTLDWMGQYCEGQHSYGVAVEL